MTHEAMKRLRAIIIVAIATAATAVAAPPQAIRTEAIKDKVRISLGRQLQIKFSVVGDGLQQSGRLDRAAGPVATVGFELGTTDATPFRVQGVATRPFLQVSNGFPRTLHYRAAARLKGSSEFFEIGEAGAPVPPGEQSLKCWESGSLVEEVILYQFALSPEPSK